MSILIYGTSSKSIKFLLLFYYYVLLVLDVEDEKLKRPTLIDVCDGFYDDVVDLLDDAPPV